MALIFGFDFQLIMKYNYVFSTSQKLLLNDLLSRLSFDLSTNSKIVLKHLKSINLNQSNTVVCFHIQQFSLEGEKKNCIFVIFWWLFNRHLCILWTHRRVWHMLYQNSYDNYLKTKNEINKRKWLTNHALFAIFSRIIIKSVKNFKISIRIE